MKKNYKKETYKNFDDWFSNRGLGGSSASALLGKNKYQTPLDIYLSVVNSKEDTNEENTNTRYGQEAEPIIRDIVKLNFKDKYKVHSPKGYEMYRSTVYPFLTATLDGVMTDLVTKEKWVLEIKTREINTKEDELEWQHHLPDQYFIQCLHYLNVMNDFVGAWLVGKLRWVDFDTGLVRKEEIRYYKILRKDFEKDIALLNETCVKFFEENVAKRIPPDIDIGIFGKEV